MKRPDLLLLIAVWEFITAFFAFIGITIVVVFIFPEAVRPWWSWEPEVGAMFSMSIGILILLCYTGIAIGGGMGLLKGRDWGRTLSIVHAAFSLFFFPIGTTIGVLSIIYLTRPEVHEYIKACSGEKQ